MKTLFCSLAVIAALPALAHAAPMARFPAIDDTSHAEPNGDRMLELSVHVDAPPQVVWQALSTAEGWKSFAVKMAQVDFRQGGTIETSYDPAAQPGQRGNIKNEILAAVPDQLLVIRNVQAPPGFAHAEEFGRTITAIEIERDGRGSRVRLSAVGYHPGAAYDDLLTMFRFGDAWTLDELRKSLAGSTAAPIIPTPPPIWRDVTDTSRTLPDGTRLLQESVIIHAPVSTVWKAFTDTATYRGWSAPVANIDMRIGGEIEAAYDPKGHLGDPDNIRQQILAYVPERLIVFRNVQAPKLLPGGSVYGQTRIVVSYRDLGARGTEVTVSGVGYDRGGEFDKLYGFFHAENAEMLETMKTAFEPKTAIAAKGD